MLYYSAGRWMMARMNIMRRSRVGLSRSGPRSAGRIGLGIVISRALEYGTAAAALSDGKSQCLRLRESGRVGLRLAPMSPNASTIDGGASGAVRVLWAVSIATKKSRQGLFGAASHVHVFCFAVLQCALYPERSA